jgi:hypothetical protein
MEFTCARSLGGSGSIVGVHVVSSNPAGTPASLELWLFSVTSTPTNDNSASAPSDAEAATVVAVIPLSASYANANNIVYHSGDIARPYICATADNKLYGRFVVRNAYTPASGETFKTTLNLIVD